MHIRTEGSDSANVYTFIQRYNLYSDTFSFVDSHEELRYSHELASAAYFRSPNCFVTFNESGVVECLRVDAAACYVFTLVREVQTSFALVSFFFCVLVCAFLV